MIRKVRKGKLVTPRLIRQFLARDFKADACCPLTTGIFIRLCAEAAVKCLYAGPKNIAPYWRVVTDEGGLIEKFPGGFSPGFRNRNNGYFVLDKEFGLCYFRKR